MKNVLILAVILSATLLRAQTPSCTMAKLNGVGPTAVVDTTGATALYAITFGLSYAAVPQDAAGNYWNAFGSFGANTHPDAMFWQATSGPNSTTGAILTSASETFSIISDGANAPSAIFYYCTNTLVSPYALAAFNGLVPPAGASTFSTGSATPAETGDLVLSAVGCNGSPFTVTSSPFANTPVVNSSAALYSAGTWETAPSTVAINPSWTLSTNTDCGGMTVIIKSSSGTPPALTPPNISLKVGALVGVNLAGHQASCNPLTAKLNWPSQIVFDSLGNPIWADVNGNTIWYYNQSASNVTAYNVTINAGCVAVVAGGNSSVGYNYSLGIAGTSAQLAHPVGLAIDSSDNLYIADQQNNNIATLNRSTGTLSIAVGSGPGTNGTCINGSFAGDGGAPTSASLDCPQGVTVLGNVLCWSDSNVTRIRCWNMGGTATLFNVSIAANTVQTIVGNGGAKACAVGGQGIAAGTNRVNVPLGLTLVSRGTITTLYWADNACFDVRGIDMTGSLAGVVQRIACNGTQGWVDGTATGTAQCNHVYDVKFDANLVGYISDAANGAIRQLKYGQVTTIAGNPTLLTTLGGNGPFGGPATLAGLSANGMQNGGVGPVGATPDNKGNLWIGNTGFNNVLEMSLPAFSGVSINGGITFSGGTTMQ